MRVVVGIEAGSYVFDASAKTITFSGLPNLTVLEQFMLITNVKTNTIIYNFSVVGLGGTFSGNVLTLQFSTLGMSDSDSLQIIIDYPSFLPLPSGAATEAKQDSEITKLDDISTKLGDDGTAAPVGSKVLGWLRAIYERLGTGLGRAWTLSSGTDSVTVVGTVTANQGTSGSQAWKVDGSSVIQPISATSLPLPTGAATEASLSAINGKISTTGNGIKVDVQASALPSGAAMASIQTDGTQKAIVRGGDKGATTNADITSTDIDADRQALDVLNMPVCKAAVSILSSSALTVNYADTESDVVDLLTDSKVSVAISVDVTELSKTANVRFLWSHDGITFLPEVSETAADATASEQPYVPYPRREDVSMDSLDPLFTGGYIGAFYRVARYFKVQARATGGTSTGKISITAQRMTD